MRWNLGRYGLKTAAFLGVLQYFSFNHTDCLKISCQLGSIVQFHPKKRQFHMTGKQLEYLSRNGANQSTRCKKPSSLKNAIYAPLCNRKFPQKRDERRARYAKLETRKGPLARAGEQLENHSCVTLEDLGFSRWLWIKAASARDNKSRAKKLKRSRSWIRGLVSWRELSTGASSRVIHRVDGVHTLIVRGMRTAILFGARHWLDTGGSRYE